MSELVGQPVRLFIADIQTADGTATDPSALTLTVRKPTGVTLTRVLAELTKTAVGFYEYVLVPAPGEGGTWAWRWEGQNPTLASEGSFDVAESTLETGDRRAPRTGPCHRWTDRDLVEDGWTLSASVSDEAVALAIEAASDVCFQLGGQRWPGLCDKTVTPATCSGLVIPYPEGGVVAWRPVAWDHGRLGVCAGGDLLDLGVYPLVAVQEAREDGDALDAAAYTVWEHRYVARLDGGRWPCAREPWQAVPTLEFDVTFGQAPPALGVLAATSLARQLLLGMTQSEDCLLDRQVRSIVREGVSVDMAVPGLVDALAAGGTTNVPEVELFVHAHNPNRLRRSARFIGL
jgi:hypothetical protein